MTISEALVNLHARIGLGKVFRIKIIQKIIGVDLGRLERELPPIKIWLEARIDSLTKTDFNSDGVVP